MLTLFSQEEALKMEIAEAEKIGEAKGMAKGMAKSMAKGMARSMAKGMATGMAAGMQKILQLLQFLDAAGRKEDAQRVIFDNAFCSQLMSEFGLE